jgi:hypothetical protein
MYEYTLFFCRLPCTLFISHTQEESTSFKVSTSRYHHAPKHDEPKQVDREDEALKLQLQIDEDTVKYYQQQIDNHTIEYPHWDSSKQQSISQVKI